MKKTPIKNKLPILQGKYRITVFRAGTKEILRQSEEIKNLIVLNTNNGINLILQRLGGDNSFSIELDNASIGTGTTAPTDADTDLETPVLENIDRSTSLINLDNVVTEWFIADGELPDDTYTEFALKCGTQLFARSIISPSHTKGANEDTLFEYTIFASNTL